MSLLDDMLRPLSYTQELTRAIVFVLFVYEVVHLVQSRQRNTLVDILSNLRCLQQQLLETSKVKS